MNRNRNRRIRRKQAEVDHLTRELEEAQQALARIQLESDSDSVNSLDTDNIQIDDYVVSKTEPYHNGTVEDFPRDRFLGIYPQ